MHMHMHNRYVALLAGLLVGGPAVTWAQPPAAPAPERQVKEIRVIRGGPGGGQADVLLGGPDLTWFAMGAEPEAVLDDPITGAPFSAEAITESVQQLADGNRIVRQATASLARDGEGRTRREQAARGPAAAAGDAGKLVTIADPVAGQRYLLDTGDRTARALPKVFMRKMLSTPEGESGQNVIVERGEGGSVDVEIRRLPGGAKGPDVTLPDLPPPAGAAGHASIEREVEAIALPDGPLVEWSTDDVQVEDLGTRSIEGVEAAGTRRTVTIEAGAIGNEQPIRIVSERWYAPALKTVVLSKRTDPRTGEHTYRLTSILTGEPDPSLFQVPPDYTIEETPEPRIRIERRVK